MRVLAALLAVVALASVAVAQSSSPAIFVGNNGNLEGSVTSFLVLPDGTLDFVMKVVTGERETTSAPCPGCNTYAASLSPNGRYLATSHAPSNDPFKQITIYEIAADASVTPVFDFLVPTSPLDLGWIDDETLAVTRTSLSGPNEVRVYQVDAVAGTSSLIDFETTGSFTSTLAIDPERRFLYAGDSSNDTISVFTINADRTLDPVDVVATGLFPLGLGVSPDGARVFAGGGISGGGDKILGYDVDLATGTLTAMPGGPFVSPGDAPKQVVVAAHIPFVFVAHGGDGTVRSFAIDPLAGLLPSQFTYDVGGQGAIGLMATMGNLLFVTDTVTFDDGARGVLSLTIEPGGTLTLNGTLQDTLGIGPRPIAPWSPSGCLTDLDGDGSVGFDDLLSVLSRWGLCPGCPQDLDGSDAVDFADLLLVLSTWGQCR